MVCIAKRHSAKRIFSTRLKVLIQLEGVMQPCNSVCGICIAHGLDFHIICPTLDNLAPIHCVLQVYYKAEARKINLGAQDNLQNPEYKL